MKNLKNWWKSRIWGQSLQPIWCLMDRHNPGKAHARKLNGVWNAECIGCRRVMIRSDTGWVLKYPDKPEPTSKAKPARSKRRRTNR